MAIWPFLLKGKRLPGLCVNIHIFHPQGCLPSQCTSFHVLINVPVTRWSVLVGKKDQLLGPCAWSGYRRLVHLYWKETVVASSSAWQVRKNPLWCLYLRGIFTWNCISVNGNLWVIPRNMKYFGLKNKQIPWSWCSPWSQVIYCLDRHLLVSVVQDRIPICSVDVPGGRWTPAVFHL